MPKAATIDLPIMSRALPVVPATIDLEAREVDVIFTTGAQVARRDWRRGEDYIEELVVSDAAIDLGRLNNGAPVLDTHYSYSVDEVVAGIIPGSARVDGANGVCRIKFTPDGVDVRADSAWGKIAAGVLRNISVGYRIVEFVEIRDEGKTPIRKVTRWEPMEISLVPMGADDGAVVRSADDKRGERREFTATFTRSGDSTMTKATAAAEGTEARNAPAETDEQRAAALTAARTEAVTAARSEFSEMLDLAVLGKRSLADVRGWLKDGKSLADIRSAVTDAAAAETDSTASRGAHNAPTDGGVQMMQENMRSLIESQGMKPKG